jgi:hypothetical protein
MKNEEYINAVNQALLSFQMIEEALKFCIGMSYEIIRTTTPLPIVFRFKPEAITHAPLEKLITMFSAVTLNDKLIKDLRKVIKWRNYCAHNSFVHEFLDRMGSSPFKPHPIEDVATIIKFSTSLVERVSDEMKSIRKLHAELIGIGD